MAHITVPTPYQLIEEVRGIQPLTILAWDERRSQKVWMTAVPENTTVDEALTLLNRIDKHNTNEMDNITHEGVRWLVRPILNSEYEETTYHEKSTLSQIAVWPRRLAWTVANGVGIGFAYWFQPDFLTELLNWSSIAYYTAGAAVFTLFVGGVQWAVLRKRLVRPVHWFAVAGIGQIIDWLLYSRFYTEIPSPIFVTAFIAMGVSSVLHLYFNKEAIKRPKLWLLLYPLIWATSMLLLYKFDPGVADSDNLNPTFSFGLLAGLAIGLVTSFTVRLRTKAEESFGV